MCQQKCYEMDFCKMNFLFLANILEILVTSLIVIDG